MSVRIIVDDAVMRATTILLDASVHCVVTSNHRIGCSGPFWVMME